jgi:hypothetical protein
MVIVGLVLAAGCESKRRETVVVVTPGPESMTLAPPLTPERARQAVLDLMREDPKAFVGSPDPQVLGDMPLVDQGNGEYRFGAFSVNPAAARYSASLDPSGGGEAYFYHGDLVYQRGQWRATNPAVQRIHKAPDPQPLPPPQ